MGCMPYGADTARGNSKLCALDSSWILLCGLRDGGAWEGGEGVLVGGRLRSMSDTLVNVQLLYKSYGAAGNSRCCQAGPCIMAPVSLAALMGLTHDQRGVMGWTFLCG